MASSMKFDRFCDAEMSIQQFLFNRPESTDLALVETHSKEERSPWTPLK